MNFSILNQRRKRMKWLGGGGRIRTGLVALTAAAVASLIVLRKRNC
jgi:hypothetical protein